MPGEKLILVSVWKDEVRARDCLQKLCCSELAYETLAARIHRDQNPNRACLFNELLALFDYIDSSYTLASLTYDGLDRLTRTTGNAGIGSSSIVYDALGNITNYNSKGHTLTYEYNDANRLQSVDDTGSENRDYLFFEYDNRGNVTTNGYHYFTYNRANQMVASGSHSYLYDGHNRRVKQTDSNGTSYSFYTQDGTLIYRENEDGGLLCRK